MQCNRDRLLAILAECTAKMRSIPLEERHRFVMQHVSEWRLALSEAYAGESVRVTTERFPREMRSARDKRIVASLRAGESMRLIAQREHVSIRMVSLLKAQNAA
jgi:uncharacterized protein (DUF2249 family)